jgi:TolB protein
MRSRVFILVCLAAFAHAGVATAAFPGENGRVAFTKVAGTGASDVYSVDPSGQAEARLTEDGISRNGAFSPDGTRLAYISGTSVYIADQYANDPQLAFTVGFGAITEIDWSPDVTKFVAAIENCAEFDCEPDIYTVNVDGTGLTNLTNTLHAERNPAWSPLGSKIVFDSILAGEEDVFTIDPDGTNLDNLTDDITQPAREPDWRPDGGRIASTAGTMDPDGSNKATGFPWGDSAWSPDGTTAANRLDSDWQVRPPNDPPATGLQPPRPKGATPLYVPLVPAYQGCGSIPINRWHGPPLEYRSCSPPRLISLLTVGTPDANGQPAEAAGHVRLDAVVGDPGTPADEADVGIHVEQADLRYHPNLNDYPGELIARLGFRITDLWNSGGPEGSATVFDFVLRVTVPCAATAGPEGGACDVTTTADSLMPGLVRERKRAIWQLERVQVFWEGADGQPQTHDDLLFANQGVFIP